MGFGSEGRRGRAGGRGPGVKGEDSSLASERVKGNVPSAGREDRARTGWGSLGRRVCPEVLVEHSGRLSSVHGEVRGERRCGLQRAGLAAGQSSPALRGSCPTCTCLLGAFPTRTSPGHPSPDGGPGTLPGSFPLGCCRLFWTPGVLPATAQVERPSGETSGRPLGPSGPASQPSCGEARDVAQLPVRRRTGLVSLRSLRHTWEWLRTQGDSAERPTCTAQTEEEDTEVPEKP